MGGFLLGALALIALQVLTRDSAAGRVDEASNVVVAGIRRALATTTAGIPDRSKKGLIRSLPGAGGGTGGGGGPVRALDLPATDPRTAELLDAARRLLEQNRSVIR